MLMDDRCIGTACVCVLGGLMSQRVQICFMCNSYECNVYAQQMRDRCIFNSILTFEPVKIARIYGKIRSLYFIYV